MAPEGNNNLGSVLPRILIVSRRTVRKSKLVDFVGEYHLDLIVKYGAVPVIVPRVSGIQSALKSFEPIHGVLLCEGEDLDPSLFKNDDNISLSEEEIEEIKRVHSSDTAIDREKDSIELTLAKLCVEKGIPFLGICRGSQVLNVACGGTLYQDIGKQLSSKQQTTPLCSHIDYNNYDSHRHPIRIESETPLRTWFGNDQQIMVNSYHHQGVKTLANRFAPMAYSPDGLIEGFYEPGHYDPNKGKFRVGLQFHPERMREFAPTAAQQEFDYPGCAYVYEEFVKAAIAFKRNSDIAKTTATTTTLKLNVEIAEDKRQLILRSFSLGKYMGNPKHISSGEPKGTTSTTTLVNEEEQKAAEKRARMLMERLSLEQLTDLMGFYKSMERVCGEVMDKKRTSYNIGIIVNLD